MRPVREGSPRPGVAVLLNVGAGAFGAAAALATTVIVSRSLGTAGRGCYFLAVAIALIVARVAVLGVDTGLVRHVAAARATDAEPRVRAIVRSGVRAVLLTNGGLVVGAALLAHHGVVPDPLDHGALAVLGVGAAATAVLAALLGAVRGLGDALTCPALQSLGLPLGRLALMGVAVGFGAGVAGSLVAWSVPALVAACVAAVVLRRRLASCPAGARGRAGGVPVGAFWRFNATRGTAAAVEVLLEWLDVLLVGVLAGASEAGVYAVVTRCVRAGEVVQQAARLAIGPIVTAASARGDLTSLRRAHASATVVMIALAWPFYLAIAVFPATVLGLFGDDFGHGRTSLTVLALGMALVTAAGPVQTVVLMAGRARWQLADKSVALAVMVVLDLVLVPAAGVTGAAVAWTIALLVEVGLARWQVRHLVGRGAAVAGGAPARASTTAAPRTTPSTRPPAPSAAAPGVLRSATSPGGTTT